MNAMSSEVEIFVGCCQFVGGILMCFGLLAMLVPEKYQRNACRGGLGVVMFLLALLYFADRTGVFRVRGDHHTKTNTKT